MANNQTQLQALGFKYDNTSATSYGKINGVDFKITNDPSAKTYTVTAACCPQDEQGAVALNGYLQQFSADRKKTVNMATYRDNTITIVYKSTLSSDITSIAKEAIDAITYFMSQCGCIPVCSVCGQQTATDFYVVRGTVQSLCPNCFNRVQGGMLQQAQIENETSVNYPLGILGAVLGGLVGAVLWIIFSMMGFVVVVAGLAAGIASVMLFEKLGKKLTLPGLIISLVISLVMLLAGMYVALGIDIYNELGPYLSELYGYNLSFFESFSFIPYMFEDSEMLGAIIHDWGYGIIGYIVTAIIMVVGYFSKRKVKNQAIRLD